jgi:hypothetical protein
MTPSRPSDNESIAVAVKISRQRLHEMSRVAAAFQMPRARGYESLLQNMASFAFGEMQRAVESGHRIVDYTDDWVEFTEGPGLSSDKSDTVEVAGRSSVRVSVLLPPDVAAELRCRADEARTSLEVYVVTGLARLAGVSRRVDHDFDADEHVALPELPGGVS